MKFEELDLEEELLDGLWAMNFRECTPVQELAIPVLLEGNDLIGCAQTGTGKTAAYLLPILNNLVLDKHAHDAIRAVIMVPTRELAQQIDQQVEGFAYYLPVSSIAVYGGNDGMVWEQQKKSLDMGVDIVIATPGRLLSYIKLGLIDLSQVKYFILDEADRMLDMGFIDDIMLIIKELPTKRQTMLFSATMPPKIRELAKNIMHQPKEIRLAVSKPNENIDQSAYICYERQKPELVNILFSSMQTGEKVLIFASSKIKVKEVRRILKRLNLSVIEMHSDLEQAEREKVMLSFKTGKVNILVATDIVSRGIDIDDIALVINYDVPHDPEDYVHRIGRTARAGEKGRAVTFVSEQDQYKFLQIECFLEKEVVKNTLPGKLGEGPPYQPQKIRRSRFVNKVKSENKKATTRGRNKKNGPHKPFKGGARFKS
ncbi:MAG: DEAD/DEAH box helicase [Bacteroidales bacterium]|jgi:ATP-dependent RNA helicase RhlE